MAEEPAAAREPGPDETYCESCGAVILEAAAMCPECGEAREDLDAGRHPFGEEIVGRPRQLVGGWILVALGVPTAVLATLGLRGVRDIWVLDAAFPAAGALLALAGLVTLRRPRRASLAGTAGVFVAVTMFFLPYTGSFPAFGNLAGIAVALAAFFGAAMCV